MKNALVVPSCRQDSLLDFLAKWKTWKNWDLVIIVEDNPTKTFDLGVFEKDNVVHIAWDDIDADLGNKSWIISHRDSAIRSYGFYYAWKHGADYIFTLDDDCYPYGHTNISEDGGSLQNFLKQKEFIDKHIQAINHWTRWTEVVNGWRTRGIPYQNKGGLNVVLNVGWWNINPDLDAVQTLSGKEKDWHGFREHYREHEIIPNGQYFPMCGMNMCFKREATPLMFFPLMGEGYPYKRFDDIWCGIIMKKVCDHLRWNVSVGLPFVDHVKASNPFVNLVKEAPGIAANEWFWETIDSINLTKNSPADCMKEIGKQLAKEIDYLITEEQSQEIDYLKKLGKAIQDWSSLFQSIE